MVCHIGSGLNAMMLPNSRSQLFKPLLRYLQDQATKEDGGTLGITVNTESNMFDPPMVRFNIHKISKVAAAKQQPPCTTSHNHTGVDRWCYRRI